MTDINYPAAHSMDTLWYAVDDAGHVAALFTEENGFIPMAMGRASLFEELQRQILGPDDDSFWTWAAHKMGVFLYRYNDAAGSEGPADLYHRDMVAARPLHVDQLPPDLRAEWKRVRFAGIRFTAAATLQPYEFFACHSPYAAPAGYVASDGVTVRPIPGREAEWAGFVARFQDREPDQAARYRFEGPTDVR